MIRRVILSPARAQAVLERAAERFGLKPAMLKRPRAKGLVRTAKGEAAGTLRDELKWSYARIAKLLACSPSHARTLIVERAVLVAAFQRRAEEEHEAEIGALDVDEIMLQNRELKEKLARLTGADLAGRLADDYAIPPRCAIVAAMLAEAYPRPVAVEAMCELYDDACERLNYGFKRGADRELIRKNVSDLNRAFSAKGLPLAAEIAQGVSGRRLTDKAAAMLSDSHQVPRASRLMAVEERRQKPKPEMRLIA